MHIPNQIRLSLITLLFLACSQVNADPLLNGLAIHSELGKESFIAGLSVSSLSSNSRDILIADEDKRIQVRVLTDRISARSFKRMWIEGMAINASSSELSENAQNMANFSNMLKYKLTAGDIFTIDRVGDGVNVVLNGVLLGQIPDTEFFDLLLRTLIGPVPLSSDFRDGLLAAGQIDDGLLARFDNTFPSDERIAAVESAVQSRPKPEPVVEGASASEVATTTKPTIEPPAPAAPAVAPAIAAPVVGSAPAIKPPTVAANTAPAATPAPKATPKPTPAPQQQALLNSDLIEEDEEDIDFTAESLLAQQLYIAELKKWSYKFLKYPRRALERSWEGNVRLAITIDREGAVKDVVIVEESEHSTLTKAAVRAVNEASPFPELPKEMSGDEFAFTLPIVFRLK